MTSKVFVEDNAVYYRGSAVIAHSGAPSRRGEVAGVMEALDKLGIPFKQMQAPATLDGGDVLSFGNHMLVGDSSRTNIHGFNFLRHAFTSALPHAPNFSFIPVRGALHLKSLATWAGEDIGFLIAKSPEGTRISEHLRQHFTNNSLRPPLMKFVPNPIAANVLRIGKTIYYAGHFEQSKPFFEKLALETPQVQFVPLDMREMNKADAAITCCSLVVGSLTA